MLAGGQRQVNTDCGGWRAMQPCHQWGCDALRPRGTRPSGALLIRNYKQEFRLQVNSWGCRGGSTNRLPGGAESGRRTAPVGSQGNTREAVGDGNANLGAGRMQVFLGLANIRTLPNGLGGEAQRQFLR